MEINSAECVNAIALSENPEFSYSSPVCKNEPHLFFKKTDNQYLKRGQLVYPENMVYPTDKNSCSRFLSSGLNIIDKDQHLTLLTWQMSGATVAQSKTKGINQINSFSFNKGITTIKYRGIDKDNNPVSYEFEVQVVDDSAPGTIYFPGNITVSNISGTCHARVFWNKPQFKDNCVADNEIIVSGNFSSGDYFEVGTTEVRYLVSDGKNEVTHSFNVTVVDNETPKLVPPQNISTACGDPIPDAYTRWEDFKAAGGAVSDNCSPDYASFRYISQTSSGIHCPYTVIRTYGISDINGNEAHVQQIINVTGEEKAENKAEPAEPESGVVLKSALDATTVTVTLVGISHVSCYGGSDGAIDLDTSSTNGPITSISWDDGPVTLDRSGLSEGTYTISITDGDGTVSQNFTINQPDQLNGSVNTVDITCNGADDGMISVLSPSGGDGTYQYRLNSDSWQSSGTFTGLPPGTYSVQIRDAAHTGCTRILSSEVFTDPGVLDASVSSTNITCNGADDGTITITSPSGGYGTFEYRLNTGSWQSSGAFSGLARGSYSVQIRDALNPTCTEILASLNLTEPEVLNASVSSTNITCNGGGDGTITITSPSGGYGSYQYQLNSNGWQNSGSFTGLLPGNYSVYIRDAANTGCVQTLTSQTITQPEVLSASASVIDPIDCYGETANVQITASGGTAPYTYSFETRSSNSTGVFTGISGSVAGIDYEWSVTDANGCTTGTGVLSISQPEELTATAAITSSILCNGGTGTVTISANGGTGNLSYTFNGIKNSSGVFNNLTAGNYNWSVTDENSCGPVSGTISISEPTGISINSAVVSNPVSCNGGTGEVTVSASGGTGDLHYTFNGQTNTSGVFSNVYAGTNLSYSVTDDNGCGPVFGSIDVDEPPALSASAAVTSAIQCNGQTAEVTISASGGTGVLSYTFNGVTQTSNVFTGISAGTNYAWSVNDANGCGPVSGTLNVSQPLALTASVTETTSISCYGETAEIKINASGGSGNITYTFNGVSNSTGVFTGVAAQSGIVWMVQDDNGCSVNGTYDVVEPAELVIDAISSNSAICEGETLTLSSSAAGGTGTLKYSWTGPNGYSVANAQNPSIVNATSAASGTYTLTVTDANNCSVSATTDVTVYVTPTMSVPANQTVCHNSSTTAVSFSGADSYSWTNDNVDIGLAASGTGNISSFIANNTTTAPVTATITITPQNSGGCSGVEQTFTITVYPLPNVEITNSAPVICDDGSTSILLHSDVEGTEFDWTATRTSGTTTGYSSGSGSEISQVLSGAGFVDYTITPRIPGIGCTGTPVVVTVEVISTSFNLGVVSSGPNATEFCNGDYFSLDFSGSPDGSGEGGDEWYSTFNYQMEIRFEWNVNNSDITATTSGVMDSPGVLGFTVNNNTGSDQEATISVTSVLYWRYRTRSRWWQSWGSWNSWEALCAGSSYLTHITVYPYLLSCPSDVNVEVDPGECTATLSPAVLDLSCYPTLTYSMTDGGSGNGNISDYSFGTGTTTVTYGAEDTPSTFETCTFDVTVTDNELPTISCPGTITVDNDPGDCGAIVSFALPTTNDNCPGEVLSLSSGVNPGEFFPLGTTTETYLVTDASGNTQTCSFDVEVNDVEAPALSCLEDQTVCAASGSQYIIPDNSWDAVVTDNCSGTVSKSYTLAGVTTGSGTSLANTGLNIGVTTVTWTATDVNGNSNNCSFEVTVNEEPAFTTDPLGQTVCLNGSLNLTAGVSGEPTPTLQWRKDGVDITGENGTTLIINPVQVGDAGVYDVVAVNSCATITSAPATITVTEPPLFTQQPANQTDCLGESVEFSVNVSSGQLPYSYAWEMRPGSTDAWTSAGTNNSVLPISNIGDAANPDGAEYRVTVTDNCGNAVVSEIARLTVNQVLLTSLQQDTVCQGGIAVFNVATSGTTPVLYEWTLDGTPISDGGPYSGATTPTLTISNAQTSEAGTYAARVTFNISQPNDNGAGVTTCQSAFENIGELVVDEGPDIVITPDDQTICPGSAIAEVVLSNANGTPGTTYSWTRDNTTVLTGLPASGSGNTINGILSSASPATIQTTTFTVTATANDCVSIGQFTISVVDDEAPTVENCVSDTTVNAGSGICGAVINYSLPTFSDNCDGSGLTGTLVEGFAPGETFPLGTTTVTYEYADVAGNGPASCSFNVTVVDNEPPDAICNSNISVELDASGVASISANDIDNSSSDNCGIDSMWLDVTSFDCTDLGENTVTLTVRDNSGLTDYCTSVVTVRDNLNPVDIVIDSIAQTAIDCYGETATVTIFAHGGVGTLTYTFGSETNQSGVFSAIQAGSYSWSVTDAQHCGDTISANDFEVVQPGELTANIALTEVTCSSGNDGKITVIGSAGGSGVYEYQLVGETAWQSDSVFANLSPGFYDIRMRDAKATSCEKEIQSNVEVYILTADIASSNISCYGVGDGSITLTNPTGGTAPYLYSLDGSSWQSSGVFSGLAADTFQVYIQDDEACVVMLDDEVVLTQPDSLFADVNYENITCYGADNGTINIQNITGGSGSYEFNIGLGWQSNSTFTGLTPGIYNIEMRDAANPSCIRSLGNSNLTEPAALTADIDSLSVTCFGSQDGEINIENITGGWGVYEFSIDGGSSWQRDSSFTGLYAGTYDVRMRDTVDLSCETILDAAFVLLQPTALAIDLQPADVASCIGSAVGFSVSVSGGAGSVVYKWQKDVSGSWSDLGNGTNISGAGSDSLVISNVVAGDGGSYRVVIADDCVTDTSDVVALIVNEITGISGDALSELCEGDDYSIQVSTFGTAPLSYQWQVDSTGLGWEDLSGETTDKLEINSVEPRQSGLYRVVVTFDSCQLASDTRELTVFPKPTIDNLVFPEYCSGELTTPIVLTGSPSNVRFDISGGTNVGLFLTVADSTAIPQFTTTSGTDTLTIVPRANGCYGDPYKLVIAVNQTPSIGVSLNKQTICSGSATNIDFSSLVDSVSYTWSIVSAGADITGYSEATDTTVAGLYQFLYNSGSSDQTVVYRVYARNDNCPGPTTDVTITVEPDFDLVVSNPDPDTVCQPDVIDLTNPVIVAGSAAGLDYEWYNGHPDLAGSTVIVDPSNISSSGTYYLKATNLSTYNYCYKIDSVTVLVASETVLDLQGADVVYKCPLDDYDLENSVDLSTTNVADISYYGPDYLELASTVVNTLGDYFIVGTSEVGCTDTIFISLENYSDVETPIFDAGSQAHVCVGSSSLFYSATAVNSTGITYSIEEPSNGNTIDANTGEVTFDPSFSGEIKVIATASGCTDASQGEFIITVHEAPVITGFNASPTLLCEGEPVYLSATAQGGSSLITASGASNTSYNIQDLSTIESPITLTESTGATVSSTDRIEVTVNITHTYDEDLNIYLVDPSGSYVLELSTDNGGSGNDYSGTIFSSESSNDITFGSAPFNNTYHPEGDITDIVGASINGDWKLRIYDDYNGDQGVLSDWSLTIEHESSSSGSFTAHFYEDGDLLGSIQNGTSLADTVFPVAGTHDYSVTIVDEYGCESTSASIEVEVQQSPDVEIEADYCTIEGRVQLTAVGGEPGAYYEWTTGDQGIDETVIVVDEVNLYGVTVTNPGGTCSRTVYMSVSTELAINGDFELGMSGVGTFLTAYQLDNNMGDNTMWSGAYTIGQDASNWYPLFRGAYDRTKGDGTGYYMIVDGTDESRVWQQDYAVEPNTNYYFSAYVLNIFGTAHNGVYYHPHLQFEINGTLFGTEVIAEDWTNDDNNPWLEKYRFYGTWNSGTATTASVIIRDLESSAQRNDFGLDDISFGTLDPLPLTMNLLDTFFCEGGLVHAESNSRNGLNPTYTWTHLESGTVYYTDTVPYLEIPNASEANEGNYKLEATDDYGCDVIPDTFFIEILEAATVDAGEDLFYCSVDSTIVLQGIFGGSADSAVWSGEGSFSDAVVRYDDVSGEYSEVIYHFSNAEISSGTATLFLDANPDNGVCDPVSDTIIITIYDSPVIDSVVVRSPICNGQTNGSAIAYVSGGEEPYSYLWNTGSTSKLLTGIGADTLWVTITDNKGCEVSDTVIITEPDSLIITARSPIVIPPSCYGANDGMAIIEVYGGIPPYTFEWDDVAALNAVADTAFYLAAGNYTVLVTDSAGCAAQTFPVEVSQPDPPVLNCPGDYIDSILPGDCGLIIDTLASPVTDGYCDYTLYYYLSGDTVDSGTGELTFFEFPVGQTFVKYVIEDNAGNRDSCGFMVWIKHVDIPEANVTCPELSPDPVYAGASCDATVALNALTFTDPCNEIDSVWHNSPYGSSVGDASGTYPVGTTEFKWFVLDKSGNMDSSCVVQVTVVDTIKPYITCPENANDSAAVNNCSKVPAVALDPTYGDLCSDATLSWKMEGATTGSGAGSVSDSSFNVGATTVTYIVEDESGNIDSCSFIVTILDVTPPSIDIDECVDVSDTAAVNYCSKVTANLVDPLYEDACWPKDSLILSWAMTGATNGSGVGSVSDSAFNVGVTTVTYTVTDPDGNSDDCSFNVTIVDVTPPNLEITGCEDVSDTAGVNNCYVIPGNMNDPVYSDACWHEDSLRLRYVITGATNASGTGSATGESFNIGVSTVEYTVTDPDGNEASCSFDVTIIHLEIPEANYSCPADTVWETASEGMCSADVALGALTYTDLCNEIDSVWNESPYRTDPDDASGTYPVGSTTFNWYITDISGNIDSCEVTVVVEDLPPSLACPPDVDTTADYAEMYNSAVALQDPVYGDNCPDPALSWTLIPPVGYESEYNSGELSGSGIYVSPDTFWVGTTTIWYYLEDASGNRDSCYFTINIQAAPIIECPPDTTIYLDGTENNCEATFDPGVPDLVQGVPPIEWTYTVSFADGRPDLTGNYTSSAPGYATPLGDIDFPEGVSTISWRAENNSGYDTCSHWVEVIDTIPPTITTQPYENCVDPIHWAIYNPSNPNPVYGVDPNLEKSPSPDYRLFEIGDTSLDLLSLEDNCCDSTEMTVHWRIEFSDTPDPQNPTGPYLEHEDIEGTGQPSTYINQTTGYANDIPLWGDGVFFTEVIHHIFYWVEDCNGNLSETIDEEIKITPRPEIIKSDY